MRVAIVSEYYPRADDQVLGIWAHRQALAAKQAGADVRVLVLHRPIPPRSAFTARDFNKLTAPVRQPLTTTLDGIKVTYVPFLAPPRWRSYGSWGVWAAPSLKIALHRLRRQWKFDLIHAHYAAPTADAVRRTRPREPLLISIHGGDILTVPFLSETAHHAVTTTLKNAKLVLANSSGMKQKTEQLGAKTVQVVHLGTDLPEADDSRESTTAQALVTVGHLVERKRHSDVLEAMALLKDTHPDLTYTIIGDGPRREALAQQARQLGVFERVTFTGQLPPEEAHERARTATLFVLPSIDEAFGVAYIEAMAGGVPVIATLGEAGPEEIAAHGKGIELVPPKNPEALAQKIADLLSDGAQLKQLQAAARATVAENFTWEHCGRATLRAYQQVLRQDAPSIEHSATAKIGSPR